MLSKKAPSTIFWVFGMTWPGIEPLVFQTIGEHSNHYTNGLVKWNVMKKDEKKKQNHHWNIVI